MDSSERVLVAKRPDHVHQGGLWEFPGGKVERGESVQEALARELGEELGIEPTAAFPLIRVRHDYPDKSVLLDVWRVEDYVGEPHGREGQPIKWLTPSLLDPREFPLANRPIVRAVQLPETCMITPDPSIAGGVFLQRVIAALDRGVKLIQLRAKSLDRNAYRMLAGQVIEICRPRGVMVILNTEPDWYEGLGADGLHLTSTALRRFVQRDDLPGRWLSASCHNTEELRLAAQLDVDFAVLGPVAPTESHPGTAPLGWETFADLCEVATFPVYALGGVGPADLDRARYAGAQGVAGIHAWWGTQ